MKIGIDARKLGPYVKRLITILPAKYRRKRFVLFFDSRLSVKKAEKFRSANVAIKFFPFSRYRKFIGYAYSQILVAGFLAKERLLLFHAAAGTMPLVYPGRCLLNIWKLEKGRAGRAFQGKIIGAAKKLIVASEFLKKDLVTVYKVPPEKIVVMSNQPKAKEIFKLYQEIFKQKKKVKKK